MSYLVQQASINQIHDLMELFDRAKRFMRNSGNPNQWNDHYPNREIVEHDIINNHLFVLVDDSSSELVGAMTLCAGPDPTYAVIEGTWLNDNPYGVIHRLAVKYQGQGLADKLMHYAEKHFSSLRIDTHPANAPMQALLRRLGYQECGIIYLDGAQTGVRIAYQKNC